MRQETVVLALVGLVMTLFSVAALFALSYPIEYLMFIDQFHKLFPLWQLSVIAGFTCLMVAFYVNFKEKRALTSGLPISKN